MGFRERPEYQGWRDAVFQLFGQKCIRCGYPSGAYMGNPGLTIQRAARLHTSAQPVVQQISRRPIQEKPLDWAVYQDESE